MGIQWGFSKGKYIPIYITIRYTIHFYICQVVFFIPFLYYLIKLLTIKLIITYNENDIWVY